MSEQPQEPASNLDTTTVDHPAEGGVLSTPEPGTESEAEALAGDGTPENTDNSVRPEDGEQDVEQTPAPVEGSETEGGE